MAKYQWTCPCPTSYPAAEMQCCIDCQAGTCQEPTEDKIHAHSVVLDWATQQAVAAGPCPGPCPPCDVKTVEDVHKALSTGAKTALPGIFLVMLQMFGPMLEQLIQDLINQLNPKP